MRLSVLMVGMGLATSLLPLGVLRAATPAEEKCTALNGLVILPSAIGLPTSGAQITAAQFVAASGAGGEHCRLNGAIRPIDPKAPEIRFSVALPNDWNGKTLMLGGGGFNGTVPNVAGQQTVGPFDAPAPVSRGFAVYGGDGGHQGTTGAVPFANVDGSFALNDEALANYAGDALKKTRDTALQIIARRYDRAPSRNYYAGGSNGGREGLVLLTRWPQDFDGAIIAYPYWSAVVNSMGFGRMARAAAAPGGFLSPAKQTVLFNAVMAACDGLDGAKDGVISNVGACKFDLASLRCPGGTDSGETCLSDPQITTVRTIEDPVTFKFPLASGETGFQGWPVLSGADIRGQQQLGSTAPTSPPNANQSMTAIFWDHLVRYAIARDPMLNSMTVDPENPGALQARLSQVEGMMDVATSDYAAFQAHGGKLLIVHGLADAVVTPRSTILWWGRLKARMGADTVRGFARFYTVPGYGHGPGGLSTYMAAWDSLPTLDGWVDGDKAPAPQIVADSNAATKGRTRPLCEYPAWPKYAGSGDVNQASSFACVVE